MAKQISPKEYTKQVTYTYNVTAKKKVSDTVTVLIYEDQPEPLNEQTANILFDRHPEVKEIHELHNEWGGRWTRKIKVRACKEN